MSASTQKRLVSLGPHESIRTDYFAGTFGIHTEEHHDQLMALWYSLAEKTLPTGERPDVRRSKHYDKTFYHPSGVTLEISAKDSHKPTAGQALLTIPGGCWGSLDAAERRDLIIDIGSWPGFRHCTRLDCQITVLNPPLTVEQIIEEVAKGRLWVLRYQSQNTYEQRDKDGLLIGSPTQYFGSKQSICIVRIYDHGAMHGWDVPSLRVECQTRKDLAHQHFVRLHKRCLSEKDADPLFVIQEELTVKDVLAQHADFRDTRQWEGRSKPRRWAQMAEKPEWWDEMLGHQSKPLSRSYKPELTWAASAKAGRDQYGRKDFLNIAYQHLTTDLPVDALLRVTFMQMAGRLKKGDDELLAEAVGPEKADEARRLVRELSTKAALLEEHVPLD